MESTVKRLYVKLRRWFFERLGTLAYRLAQYDTCELCGEDFADGPCVGCGRRICIDCNSGYYEDEELCKECRKDITPEEEAQDLVDQQEL